jgi:hypothetical protein
VAFAKFNPSPAGGISPGGPNGAHATSIPRKIRELDTPQVKSPVRTAYMPGARSISWKAIDPNKDDLLYSVYLKMEGSSDWSMKAENIKTSQYTIDTASLADGVYRARVVVSDQASNPEGRALRHQLDSKPFVIANSLPSIDWGSPQVSGRDASIPFTATAGVSPLYQVEYSIKAGTWRVVFPEDGITDQTSEDFEVKLNNLSQGEHILLVRAVDMIGNVGTSQFRIRVP